jgi:hypothetical protein
MFVLVPIQDIDFQRHVLFLCSVSWEVIARFVDIVWIIDRHYLNICFRL